MFPKKGKKFHQGLRSDETEIEFKGLIASALKTELGSTHQSVKTLVRWTGASDRTVKHWLAGTHGPSGEHLVALVRNSDAVLNAFMLMANRRAPMMLAKYK